jgi:hypothetical protein
MTRTHIGFGVALVWVRVVGRWAGRWAGTSLDLDGAVVAAVQTNFLMTNPVWASIRRLTTRALAHTLDALNALRSARTLTG